MLSWNVLTLYQDVARGVVRRGAAAGALSGVACALVRGATRSRLSRVWACQFRAGPVIFSRVTSIPGGNLPVSACICPYLSVKQGQGSQAGKRGAVEKKGRG